MMHIVNSNVIGDATDEYAPRGEGKGKAASNIPPSSRRPHDEGSLHLSVLSDIKLKECL